MQTRSIFHRGRRPAAVSLLSPLGLLAALLALGAAPARATDISDSVTGPIFVGPGDTLNIYANGSVTPPGPGGTAIDVEGGTVNIYGGSVSAVNHDISTALGILVDSGTVNVYGGSVSITGPVISKPGEAIAVAGGTVNIFGGSISGPYGVYNSGGGSVNVYGCGLQLAPDGTLTGTLQNGNSTISTNTSGPINLISTCVSYNVCSVLYDQSKAHKPGSTVPIKIQVCDASGVNVSSAALPVMATNLTWQDGTASSQVEDTGSANPDSNFRYDASLAGYVFNLSTRGLSTGTWKLWFTVGADPTLHTVQFDVK